MLELNLLKQVVDLSGKPISFKKSPQENAEIFLTTRDLIMEALNKNVYNEEKLSTQKRYEILKYLVANPTVTTLKVSEDEFEFIAESMRAQPYHVMVVGNLYDSML